MDFNTDEALDEGEPEGILGAFGITLDMTGKDVELEGEGLNQTCIEEADPSQDLCGHGTGISRSLSATEKEASKKLHSVVHIPHSCIF